jgi:hypothetical protein
MMTECRAVGRIGNYELMTLVNSPRPTLTYCATFDREWRADQPENQISVSLPASFTTIKRVSLLSVTPAGRATATGIDTAKALQAVETPGRAPTNRSRQFTFQILGPEILSPDLLDDMLVQLWDDSGHLIANVPFLRLPVSAKGADARPFQSKAGGN